MREFKFRVWDEHSSRMLYWDMRDLYASDAGELRGEIHDVDLSKIISYQGIMQYTGLKDKNGKEIFEGDVVSGEFGNNNFTGTIQYSEKLLRFEIKIGYETTMLTGFNNPEIIGDIHTTPELINPL